MNRKELFMKKRKIATILLAACLLLGNVSVANAASIDNGNKVHFNTEDNDTDLTLLQSKIATEEVTCDFTDATNDGASAYADTICGVQARWNIISLIRNGHRIQKFLVHMQKHQKGL